MVSQIHINFSFMLPSSLPEQDCLTVLANFGEVLSCAQTDEALAGSDRPARRWFDCSKAWPDSDAGIPLRACALEKYLSPYLAVDTPGESFQA
jgi:hypothetical protein